MAAAGTHSSSLQRGCDSTALCAAGSAAPSPQGLAQSRRHDGGCGGCDGRTGCGAALAGTPWQAWRGGAAASQPMRQQCPRGRAAAASLLASCASCPGSQSHVCCAWRHSRASHASARPGWQALCWTAQGARHVTGHPRNHGPGHLHATQPAGHEAVSPGLVVTMPLAAQEAGAGRVAHRDSPGPPQRPDRRRKPHSTGPRQHAALPAGIAGLCGGWPERWRLVTRTCRAARAPMPPLQRPLMLQAHAGCRPGPVAIHRSPPASPTKPACCQFGLPGSNGSDLNLYPGCHCKDGMAACGPQQTSPAAARKPGAPKTCIDGLLMCVHHMLHHPNPRRTWFDWSNSRWHPPGAAHGRPARPQRAVTRSHHDPGATRGPARPAADAHQGHLDGRVGRRQVLPDQTVSAAALHSPWAACSSRWPACHHTGALLGQQQLCAAATSRPCLHARTLPCMHGRGAQVL